MNLIFGSYKGRIVRNVIGLLAVVAFISMVISANGSESSTTAAEQETAQSDTKPQINFARVYAKPTEDASSQPSSEPTEKPDNENDKQAIINASSVPANSLMASWITYDYRTPTTKDKIPGYPQDGANQKTMNPKYDAWVKTMQDKKELSTGSVTDVKLDSIDYNGTLSSGSGKATFTVTVSTTVANSQVGSAGTNVVKKYKVTTVRLEDLSTEDDDNWFVSDLSEVA